MFGEARLDMLGLQRLVQAADDLDGLAARHLHALERLVGGDDPPHLLLDLRQVLVGDRPRGPHVVIEARTHRGAEGELHAVEQPHHRAGHHMGRRMPHHGERPRIALEEHLKRGRAFVREHCVEPHGPAVEEGRDRLAFFSLAGGGARHDLGDDVGEPRSGRELADGAIGEADGRHGAAGLAGGRS